MGIFNILKKISNLQIIILPAPIRDNIIFPILNKIKRDYLDRFPEIFIKLKFINIIFLLPIFSFIFVLKDILVPIIFSERWQDINDYIFLSCFLGFIFVLRFSLPFGLCHFRKDKTQHFY